MVYVFSMHSTLAVRVAVLIQKLLFPGAVLRAYTVLHGFKNMLEANPKTFRGMICRKHYKSVHADQA